jgi:hypothetical protein
MGWPGTAPIRLTIIGGYVIEWGEGEILSRNKIVASLLLHLRSVSGWIMSDSFFELFSQQPFRTNQKNKNDYQKG